jgi:hypothetical protein
VDLPVDTGGAWKITDFKTSRSRCNQDHVEDAAGQFVLYASLIQDLSPGKHMDLEFLVVTKTKTKKPGVERHSLKFDRERAARTKFLVERVWSAMKAGHLYPSPSPMSCGSPPSESRAAVGPADLPSPPPSRSRRPRPEPSSVSLGITPLTGVCRAGIPRASSATVPDAMWTHAKRGAGDSQIDQADRSAVVGATSHSGSLAGENSSRSRRCITSLVSRNVTSQWSGQSFKVRHSLITRSRKEAVRSDDESRDSRETAFRGPFAQGYTRTRERDRTAAVHAGRAKSR